MVVLEISRHADFLSSAAFPNKVDLGPTEDYLVILPNHYVLVCAHAAFEFLGGGWLVQAFAVVRLFRWIHQLIVFNRKQTKSERYEF